ncbi:uncharacterized protein [Panulirus ornatus]|uniref:uncharacterized protein n=1 Tax=Panulirus ornatus TaxID=150431 RepID=UPI003A869277
MRIIVCILIVAGVACGQVTTNSADAPVAIEAKAAAADPALSAAPSPSAAPAAAATPAAAAASTTAPAQNFGPQFFGPGLNNPLATLPDPFVIQQARRVAETSNNIRVFVDVDGEVRFTDQFGRPVEEIVDEFGRDVSEFLDPQEYQERLTAARRQELERRRRVMEMQLLQEFRTNPGAFDRVTGGAAAATAAAGTATAGAAGGAPQPKPTFRIVV